MNRVGIKRDQESGGREREYLAARWNVSLADAIYEGGTTRFKPYVDRMRLRTTGVQDLLPPDVEISF